MRPRPLFSSSKTFRATNRNMNVFITFLIVIVTALLTLSSVKSELPECFQKVIHPIPDGPVWYQYTVIDQYLYRGKTTYLATSRCCDRMNPLYDEECTY